MSDGLSLKEIEQLEQKVKNSNTAATGKAKDTAPFDFRLPLRVSDAHLKILKNTFEFAAENLSAFFSSRLQAQVNVKLFSTDQIYYSEFTPSIANPSCIYFFKINDCGTKGLININIDLAFELVDRLLGGSGNSSKPSNEITLIEQRILKILPDRINYEFENAWSVYGNYKIEIKSFESDIENVQLTVPHESVMLSVFEMNINDRVFYFNICYETSSLDALLKNFPDEMKQSSAGLSSEEILKTRNILSSHLMNTTLPVKVEFGASRISFNELMNLAEGDIIILSKKIIDEHEIKVADKVLFYGRPGVLNNNKAVKISRKENITEKFIG